MANQLIEIDWDDVVSVKTSARTQEFTLADYVGHETTFTNFEVKKEKQVNGKDADRVYVDAKNGTVDTHRIQLPKLDGDLLLALAERKNAVLGPQTKLTRMVYPAGKGGNGARLVDTSKK